MPMFIEFHGLPDTIILAHNAPFDPAFWPSSSRSMMGKSIMPPHEQKPHGGSP